MLIYVPVMSSFFKLSSLDFEQLGFAIICGFISVVWYEFVKWYYRFSVELLNPEQPSREPYSMHAHQIDPIPNARIHPYIYSHQLLHDYQQEQTNTVRIKIPGQKTRTVDLTRAESAVRMRRSAISPLDACPITSTPSISLNATRTKLR